MEGCSTLSHRSTFFVIVCAIIYISSTKTKILALQHTQQTAGGSSGDDDQSQLSRDELVFLESLEYLHRDDVESAWNILERDFQNSARNSDPGKRLHRLSQRKSSLGGGTTFTSEYKLKADLEQARYLSEILHPQDPEKADFFASVVVPAYEAVSIKYMVATFHAFKRKHKRSHLRDVHVYATILYAHKSLRFLSGYQHWNN